MSSQSDHFNTDLLSRMPLDARLVLDVGCGTGALGAAYHKQNPRARVLGIEIDPAAAQIAAQRLDEVAAVDVEDDPLPFEAHHGFDCIVYGDVLAHLVDPWEVIRRHSEALSDNGVILICVPNIEHWSFADRLLRGTWEYDEQGLLDGGHVRWFSLETMRKGLVRLGLTPCDVHGRVLDGDDATKFASAMAPGLRAMGIDPQAYLGRAAPLQYVWRVRRAAPNRMLIAASMLPPIGGVSHVRVVYPLQAMSSDPCITTHIGQPNELPAHDPNGPRIFIFHRAGISGEHGMRMLRGLVAEGWLVVTEFDDHPDYFRAMQGDDLYTFSGVHAVQTSTPALAEVLRTKNPEVMVFPNTIRELPEVNNFTDPDSMTLFFGALNREPDWRPLLEVLNAVAQTVGDRLRFSIVHDKLLFDALETPHKRFTPTCDHDTYLKLLGESEISFMPLSDTPFNRAKSDLKFIEAGACRVASLASHIVYEQSVEDGRTGLIFRDAEELRARLLRLIAMPGLARDLGDAARSYVAEHRMLAYQVGPRIAWYRSLWARRTDLTEALFSRVEGIRSPV